jgi:hypothetical protein
MTITFEIDNNVILYALERIVSYARNNQYMCLAQSIWWISSTIRLQEGLVIHIDNLTVRSNIKELEVQETLPKNSSLIGVHPSRVERIQNTDSDYSASEDELISTMETIIYNENIDNCDALLEQSKQERKAIGCSTRQASKIAKRKAKKMKPIKSFGNQTEGIEGSELRRRKAAGECQRCAWPRDRKGSHKTLDCFRWKRLEKGTAPYPKKKTT